jgi:hypothetical protein
MAQRKEKREKEQLENLNQTAIAFHCQPVSPVFSPHLLFDLFFSRLFSSETYSTFSTRYKKKKKHILISFVTLNFLFEWISLFQF